VIRGIAEVVVFILTAFNTVVCVGVVRCFAKLDAFLKEVEKS
jgi:hypothetical protein